MSRVSRVIIKNFLRQRTKKCCGKQDFDSPVAGPACHPFYLNTLATLAVLLTCSFRIISTLLLVLQISGMTSKKSERKNDYEDSMSPRRSPRFQKQTSTEIPRRSPRLMQRRKTPFPKEKIIFSPPPKQKQPRVRFAPSVDPDTQPRFKAQIVALGLGTVLVLTSLVWWLI